MTFRTESELSENPDLIHSVEGVEDIRKWLALSCMNVVSIFPFCIIRLTRVFCLWIFTLAVVANTPARQKSLRIEPRFRLLLKLIKFTREGCKFVIQHLVRVLRTAFL